ncbi:MAG TPA: hypothetical protein VKC66_18360 [Xanthobacteraceae bacterium]|nr:hypothetical protein [Xanthobacteraceae bacterium]
MSMIDPSSDVDEQGMFWDGTRWCFNPSPPIARPPCSCGGHPQHCTCGCHPNPCKPPPWGFPGWQMRKCYDDLKKLESVIRDLMKDILAEGVPPTNVIGVTDGSNAPPGMVGEYVTSVAAGSMTGPNIIIPAITVPPGDWMVDFTFSLDMATGGTFTEFVAIIPANQRPEGMEPTESPIVASLNQGGSPPSEGFQALVMPGSTIRINNTTPQLVVMQMFFFPSIPAGTPQVYNLFTQARRMR